ncbi:hypothetical protein R3W88_021257 [Solanum pinnatisectum]|uniref:NPH3 domain-containing protein n=1 Tax=Solanum pinnatisectum TaxID=50273 RepID=A0AAV9LUU0_9SOLN|nr:hypothetical protein R3W88_021257 [Solanum pinnatisectum]
MDVYITEVATHPCLKPSKCLALFRLLPESARDSYNAIDHAMVHSRLSEEEKMKVCSKLSYEKLSSRLVATLLIIKISLRNLLLQETNQVNPYLDSPCSFVETDNSGNTDQ